MNILEAILSRVEGEEYTNEPVEFDKILDVIEAGANASCAGHLQVWKFIVVTKKDKIQSLIPYCLKKDALYTAQFAIIVCVEESPYESFYGLRGKRLYAIQDCGAAIQNMLLAAYALGIGAHWIRAFDEDRVKDLFKIPEGVRPQGILTLGYPVSLPPKKPIKNMQAMVFYNGYGSRIEYGYRVLRDYSIDVQQYKKWVQEHARPLAQGLADHAKKLFLKTHARLGAQVDKWRQQGQSRKEKPQKKGRR